MHLNKNQLEQSQQKPKTPIQTNNKNSAPNPLPLPSEPLSVDTLFGEQASKQANKRARKQHASKQHQRKRGKHNPTKTKQLKTSGHTHTHHRTNTHTKTCWSICILFPSISEAVICDVTHMLAAAKSNLGGTSLQTQVKGYEFRNRQATRSSRDARWASRSALPRRII